MMGTIQPPVMIMIQLQFAEFDEWIPGPRGTDFNDTSVWLIQWVKCSLKNE